jgi:hypothetical protein
MAEAITFPITTDPAEIAAIGFDYMESVIPGWNRARGDQASQIIAACAQMMAPARDTAADVPVSILRYLGRWVDGLAPIDATPAQTTATVTALDNAGYTISDGTRFLIRTSGDSGEVFASVGTVTIAPGSTSTAAGAVALVAETAGAAGSGLPAISVVEPVEALAWINTVTLTAQTTGGIDAETDDEYLARWVLMRSLSRVTPIKAEHFADIARLLVPSVGRALGIDNYDPVTTTFGNEKMVTVAVADVTGEPVSSGVKTSVKTLLEGLRELNFVVNVIDPTYTTIKVTASVTTYPGFDTAGVQAAVVAALTDYFSPATWGTPFGSDATVWIDETAVRYLEVAEAINRVEGVHFINSLTIATQAGALGTTDVPLSTPADLTRPGTLSITAVAP